MDKALWLIIARLYCTVVCMYCTTSTIITRRYTITHSHVGAADAQVAADSDAALAATCPRQEIRVLDQV